MRFYTLPEWQRWLETLHPAEIELGLERVALVAEQLGVLQHSALQHSALVITVAGSNGKGSTIAALAALLKANLAASPATIGVYTSPHLCDFNERITVNGTRCTDRQICEAFDQVDQARLIVSQQRAKPLSLTYFEFTTLAALVIFSARKLDYWLLEVGLGGRLDAVNIVDADIAIITTIAMDHTQWLGDTLEQIAVEKAGIARINTPVIIGDSEPPQSLYQTLARVEAGPIYSLTSINGIAKAAAGQHGFYQSEEGLSWVGSRITGELVTYNDLERPQLHSASWSCALQAAALLDKLPSQAAITRLLQQTALAGRGSRIEYRQREFVLDVAHNPQAINHLLTRLSAESSTTGYTLIFALLDDKPLDTIIEQLSGIASQWVLPKLANCPRAYQPSEIEHTVRRQGQRLAKTAAIQNTCTNITASVAEAIDWAIHNTTVDDRIIVCGSFYLIGEALALLGD